MLFIAHNLNKVTYLISLLNLKIINLSRFCIIILETYWKDLGSSQRCSKRLLLIFNKNMST